MRKAILLVEKKFGRLRGKTWLTAIKWMFNKLSKFPNQIVISFKMLNSFPSDPWK